MTKPSTLAAGLAVLALLAPAPAARAQGAEPDANTTRLFFGPTGRTLDSGEGYVGLYQVVLPFVQFGVSDRVTLGGGTPLFFGSGSGHPFWFTPKVAIVRGPRVNVAAGALHFLNLDDDGHAGIAYGVATVGSPGASVTAGAGWAYSRFDDDSGNAAIVMIGAERRIAPRLKLMTENYVHQDGGLVCVGVRFLGDRLSADLGLAGPVGADSVFLFPMVNFVWRFGDSAGGSLLPPRLRLPHR
jgi:hypothetical protein